MGETSNLIKALSAFNGTKIDKDEDLHNLELGFILVPDFREEKVLKEYMNMIQSGEITTMIYVSYEVALVRRRELKQFIIKPVLVLNDVIYSIN